MAITEVKKSQPHPHLTLLKKVLEAEEALPGVRLRNEHQNRQADLLIKQKLAIQQHARQVFQDMPQYQFRAHWHQLCRQAAPPRRLLTEEEKCNPYCVG